MIRTTPPSARRETRRHTVIGAGPDGPSELDWRRTLDGTVHAATLEGVAAGQWPRRFEVAALLEDPERGEELARARWFD
ncbi:hypothetical protein [Streptomyces sp. 2224.1]|uniref:hypothetical protein n=1 Tax=Streptomyces sp. 2224.1 TaxID=1881020 RepID=UPI000B85BB5A|nr:hypothetical protein [Streptomyces sp. 2224.1]